MFIDSTPASVAQAIGSNDASTDGTGYTSGRFDQAPAASKSRKSKYVAVLLLAGMLVLLTACTEEPPLARPQIYTSFPASIDTQCRNGSATIYDECSDQVELFKIALAQANAEGKVLLVQIGAEWCIWCHVFDAHINGERGSFRYTYGLPDEPDARYTSVITEHADSNPGAADPLREFVAGHFVVVHVDIQNAPRGNEVMEVTGALDHYPGGIPFVYVVDSSGRYVAHFDHDAAERKRNGADWYRGYDRIGLLDQLKTMHGAAAAKH